MVPYYANSKQQIYINQFAFDQSEENILLMLPSISSLLSDIELENTDPGIDIKEEDNPEPASSAEDQELQERLQELMQNFDIHRAGGGAPDLPRNIPADFSHSLFNSIFPYSGDILFAQLHPGEVGESSSENNESDAEGNEDLHNTCTTELQRAEDLDEPADSGGGRGPKKLYLWQFLLQLIRDPKELCITWTDSPPEFILSDPQQVAKLWTEYKGRGGINVDSLCRALRYYYSRDILKRRQGMGRFVYSFSEAALKLDFADPAVGTSRKNNLCL